MSELACTCPHCNQELNVESEFAGQVVACPACNGELTIPEAPASQAPVLQAPALGTAAAPIINVPGAATQAQPQAQAPVQNPYQSPASNVVGPGYGQGHAISPGSIRLFTQTSPWVTLFAILGSIMPTILLGLGLFSAFAGVSAGAAGAGMASGLMLAVMGAIYFLPAWRLWQYRSAIGKLSLVPSQQGLDGAIDRQRCFWKTIGIITLIGFTISVAMLIVALTTGASMAEDPSLFFSE